MRRRTLKTAIVVLTAALVFAMMPIGVSAASYKPAKAKITSYTVGKVSAKTSTTTVTIKWKKVPKATGYEIYEKLGDGKWGKIKKVGRFTTGVKIKKAPTGKYYVKVRALRKVKGKTHKGSFSAAKSKFIKTPLTLEKYVNKISPNIKKELNNQPEVKEYGSIAFKGNNLILTIDLANEPEFTQEMVDSLTEQDKQELNGTLASEKSEAEKLKKSIRNNTGVNKVGVVIKIVYKSTEITSRTF